ncbi:protein of unknown function [Rhodovastum atsumiense]|nr:protein of unknown function [Rhodovastum atsumiense]
MDISNFGPVCDGAAGRGGSDYSSRAGCGEPHPRGPCPLPDRRRLCEIDGIASASPESVAGKPHHRGQNTLKLNNIDCIPVF